MYHISTKDILDTTVVKADGRKKLSLTAQRLIDYCNVKIASRREKENMEIKTTAFASKKKQHMLARKSEQTQALNFFLILIYFSAWSHLV